jgi:hypothetical protein
MPTLADALRFLRYMHGALLGLLVVIAVLGETVGSIAHDNTPVILYVLYALAVGNAVLGLVLRQRFAGPAADALRANPADTAALLNWLKGQLVPLAQALTIGMFGLVARLMGASTLRAAPLYAAAVLLMLILRPSDPTA